MGTSVSVCCSVELHILLSVLIAFPSEAQSIRAGRWHQLSGTVCTLLIRSKWSNGLSSPLSHPTKTMGTVCLQVDKPDSILAQNEYVRATTGYWKRRQMLKFLPSWMDSRKDHAQPRVRGTRQSFTPFLQCLKVKKMPPLSNSDK